MRIFNESMIDAPVSLAADAVSKPIYLGHIAQCAIQAIFTGTPDGSFKLQCSNDPGHPNAQARSEQYADVVNWTDIAGSTQLITAAGDLTYNIENIGYLWVRIVWTFTASTGSLTSCRCNGKGV